MSKSHTSLIAAAVASVLMAQNPAEARPVVVALSPHVSAEVQEAQVRALITHVAEIVEPGERARFLDADSGKLIATFAVPDHPGYAHPRAKMKANREALRALKAFAEASREGITPAGRIDLPGLLRSLGLDGAAGVATDVIVTGSPIHDDPRAPAFSMTGAKVPGDGHIPLGLERTLYGTAGQEGRLAEHRLYFHTTEDWAVNIQHAHYVERFWALSVAARGGVLAGFGPDLAALLEKAATGMVTVEAYALEDTAKLEMIVFGRRPVAEVAIYDRDLSAVPAEAAQIEAAEQVEVAISWDCNGCDLDLYARPGEGAAVIYYGNKRTGEGELFKDFRRSPALSNGFETIAFDAPIDLDALILGVNFFAGRAGGNPVRGEVRVAIGADTWAAPFEIGARAGNLGIGSRVAMEEGRAPNAGWVMIDPLAVVGRR